MKTEVEDANKLAIEAHESAQQAFIEIAHLIDALPDKVNALMSSSLKKITIASSAYPIVGIDRTKFRTSELEVLDMLIQIKELQGTIMLASLFSKPQEVKNENE